MSSSEPFLHPSQEKHVCKICDKVIIKKKEECWIKDWEKIRKHALQWRDLPIPEQDRLSDFPDVHERIREIQEGYVHNSCRTDIRLALRSYETKYKIDVSENNAPNTPIDDPLSVDVEQSASTPCTTRSSLSSPTDKRTCFICNTKKELNISRISKEKLADQTMESKKVHLQNPNGPCHIAAKRLDLMLKGSVVDVYAADVCYHGPCMLYFNQLPKQSVEDDPMIEVVKEHFINYVTVKVCKEKNAYLLNDLLNDIISMSLEHNIDPVFTNTRSFKRYLEANVTNIRFYKAVKRVIVYASDIDPILYSESTLQGHGLRKNDIIAAFAKMIHRVRNELDDKDNIEWPASPDELLAGLAKNKPIAELYNAIYMTIDKKWKSSAGLNEYGFAKVESRNIANKIWSIASDWTALLTGKKNAKQIILAMTIHRLTASKEVISMLNKAGHAISYNDVRLQNEEWLLSTKEMGGILSGLMKEVVTHSSLDNNDMRQDTNTGHCTTHHTNFLVFQPNPPENGSTISSSSLNRCSSDVAADPNYKIGKPLAGPPLLKEYKDIEARGLVDEALAKDVLWSLAGGLPCADDEEDMPLLGSWTAFNKTVCDEETVKSLLNYLPANENPPEYQVCKEYLEFILEVMDCLDIPRVFVHADEQVYARILHLVWKHKDRFMSIIPLMGGFHQLRVFQKILYKRHNVIGYQEWYSDAGIIAEGSAPQAFEGRHYYRSMRVHKEGFDALAQYRIEEITDHYKNLDNNLLENLKTLRLYPSATLVKEMLQSPEFKEFLATFLTTSDARSQMTMQYLKDISLMLSIVSAVRESSYDRHLQAEREFLKLVFAFDHVNYAKYNTYYHVFMTNLKNTDSDAYKDLVTFGFGCTNTEKGRFSTQHGDLTTEHFNKETKGTAGPFRSGYSTDLHAVNRWIKTSHYHAKLRKAVKNHFRLYTSSTHKEMTPRNKKRHFEHVQSLKKKLREYNCEPFKPGPVTNIVTGKEVDGDIVKGLIGAAEKGDEKYKKFVTDRLVTGKVPFFHPVSKNNINTGAEKKRKRSKKVDVLIEEKQAFGVMVAKCSSKEEAFSYPITSLPLSIANPDGSLYSSSKSTFRNHLIDTSFSNKCNSEAMWIIDAGYAIRQVKPQDTYKDFYSDLLEWMLPNSTLKPSVVVIAVDDYRKDSTKEGERTSRRGGKDEGKRIHVTGMDQKMPRGQMKWSDFLTNGENKNDLMSVFADYLKTEEGVRKANCVPIIFSGREQTWEIRSNQCETAEVCNHEEADTKIPLFASKANGNVIAVSSDSDILILMISTYATIKPAFRWQMRYEHDKYADIEDIFTKLGKKVSPLLTNFHAITGCDTSSYFFKVGKITPFKRALDMGNLHLLESLGTEPTISDECLSKCKEFIRTVLYRGDPGESYLETRVRLYVKQPTASKSTMTIPPDEDSCTQHILRVNHQLYKWKHCTLAVIPFIDPCLNGWKMFDGTFTPVWFTGPQFPSSSSKKTKKANVNDGYEADNEKKKGNKKTQQQKKVLKRVKDNERYPNPGRKFRRLALAADADEETRCDEVAEDVTELGNNAETSASTTSNVDKHLIPVDQPLDEVQSNNDANDRSDDGSAEDNDSDSETDVWEHLSDFDVTMSDSSDSDWM